MTVRRLGRPPSNRDKTPAVITKVAPGRSGQVDRGAYIGARVCPKDPGSFELAGGAAGRKPVAWRSATWRSLGRSPWGHVSISRRTFPAGRGWRTSSRVRVQARKVGLLRTIISITRPCGLYSVGWTRTSARLSGSLRRRRVDSAALESHSLPRSRCGGSQPWQSNPFPLDITPSPRT